MGDSQARYLDQIIRQKLSVRHDIKANVNSTFWPGKTVVEISNLLNPERFPSGSHVVVVAGTNDVFRTSGDNIKMAYDTIHSKLPNCQVTVVLVPPRSDIKRYNYHIKKLNFMIRHHIAQYENISFIDPFKFLKFAHIASDGLHLDRKGKDILCNKILSKLFGIVITETAKQGAPKSKKYTNSVHSDTRSRNNPTRNQSHLPRMVNPGGPEVNMYSPPLAPLSFLQRPPALFHPPASYPPYPYPCSCCLPTYKDVATGNVQPMCVFTHNMQNMYPTHNMSQHEVPHTYFGIPHNGVNTNHTYIHPQHYNSVPHGPQNTAQHQNIDYTRGYNTNFTNQTFGGLGIPNQSRRLSSSNHASTSRYNNNNTASINGNHFR